MADASFEDEFAFRREACRPGELPRCGDSVAFGCDESGRRLECPEPVADVEFGDQPERGNKGPRGLGSQPRSRVSDGGIVAFNGLSREPALQRALGGDLDPVALDCGGGCRKGRIWSRAGAQDGQRLNPFRMRRGEDLGYLAAERMPEHMCPLYLQPV